MICPKLTVNLTAQKLQLLCMLVYTGKSFPNFRARLRHNTDKNIPFCKLRIFRSACRFGNLFKFKYSLERKILSGIVYCNTCSKCKFIHYGKTFGYFFTSFSIFFNVALNLTEKLIKNTKDLVSSDHLLQSNSLTNFGEFDISASDEVTYKGKFTYQT